MENNRPLLIVILLISLCCLSYLIYQTDQKREVKQDQIELSNIKYGLFNVDEWKKILTNLLTKKIEEFELKG